MPVVETKSEKKCTKVKCTCGSLLEKRSMNAHLKTFIHISKTQPLFRNEKTVS